MIHIFCWRMSWPNNIQEDISKALHKLEECSGNVPLFISQEQSLISLIMGRDD